MKYSSGRVSKKRSAPTNLGRVFCFGRTISIWSSVAPRVVVDRRPFNHGSNSHSLEFEEVCRESGVHFFVSEHEHVHGVADLGKFFQHLPINHLHSLFTPYRQTSSAHLGDGENTTILQSKEGVPFHYPLSRDFQRVMNLTPNICFHEKSSEKLNFFYLETITIGMPNQNPRFSAGVLYFYLLSYLLSFLFPTNLRLTISLFEYFFGVRDFCPFPVGLPHILLARRSPLPCLPSPPPCG